MVNEFKIAIIFILGVFLGSFVTYQVDCKNVDIIETVDEIKVFKNWTMLYSKSNLSGTRYYYLPETKVIILENISSYIDKIFVIQTGRIAYVRNDAYK